MKKVLSQSSVFFLLKLYGTENVRLTYLDTNLVLVYNNMKKLEQNILVMYDAFLPPTFRAASYVLSMNF